MREAVVVPQGLEQRQRLPSQALYLVRRVRTAESCRCGDRARECDIGRVFARCRAFGGGVGNHFRSREIGPVEGVRELELQAQVEPVRTSQR